jgi:hypothetical protein
MNPTVVAVLALALVSLPACRTVSREASYQLRKPVNCETAERDIRVLESEKASVAKRFAEGVTAVVPAGAVLSIITLQEKDKLEVAIGIYNKKITEKIREIKETCGLE